MNTAVLNVVGVYIGWLACVLGAAHDSPWLGPAVVLLLLVVHCWLIPQVARELRLLFAVGVLGFVIDTLLAAGLGAVGGPLSYYAGARLGALTLHLNFVVSLGILAFVWAIAMLVLLRLAR